MVSSVQKPYQCLMIRPECVDPRIGALVALEVIEQQAALEAVPRGPQQTCQHVQSLAYQ